MTLIGLLAPWDPLADIANHFRPATLAGFVVLSAIVAAVRDRALMAAALAGLAVNIVLFALPFFTTAGMESVFFDRKEPSVPISIVSFNLEWNGRDLHHVAAYLQEKSPDLVLLQEADQRNREALLPLLKAHYAHAVICNSEPCDVVILSKIAVRARGTLVNAGQLPHAVWADVSVRDGMTLRVASVHTIFPVAAAPLAAQMNSLAEWAGSVEGPLLLSGDFNVTPWSWLMQKFQWATGLKRHATLLRSWPTASSGNDVPLPFFLIDHILTTPGIRTLSIDTGPDLGSDHLPIVARLAVPAG